MTVGELRKRISSREFAEWQALEMLDGPGDPMRRDLYFAAIMQMMVRLSSSKGSVPPLGDFLLEFGAPRLETSKSAAREVSAKLTSLLSRAKRAAGRKRKEQ